MGMLSFIKDAGEKLFGIGKAEAAAPDAPAAPSAHQLSQSAAKAIAKYIEGMKLHVERLNVAFDAETETVTFAGVAQDQTTREKALLCCGNAASVVDNMNVANHEPAFKWYTVARGGDLSKICKALYGTPNKYSRICEANKPMLTHPDTLYPGQVLRIPAA